MPRRPSARAGRLEAAPRSGPVVEYASVAPWKVVQEFGPDENGAAVAVWCQVGRPHRWSIQVGMRLEQAVSLKPYIPVHRDRDRRVVDVARGITELVEQAQQYIEDAVQREDARARVSSG